MFPMIVITWRLGNISSDLYERVLPTPDQKERIFEEISSLSGGIYYLETCQRSILVVDSGQSWIAEDIIHRYFSILGIQDIDGLEPEVFLGIDGLLHLAKVISGLDSVVIGEYEIHHQFKTAYMNSKPYLGNNLRTYMQHLFKIGKTVRKEFQLDRMSTIEAVVSAYPREFTAAKSIGILGSGKMSKLCVQYLDSDEINISVYSSTQSRIGQKVGDITIQPLDQLEDSIDILITATNQAGFISPEFVNQNFGSKKLLLVDLGMPRNCTADVTSMDNITLVNIESLVEGRDDTQRIEFIDDTMKIIEDHVNRIIKDYQFQLKSNLIVNLRSDLSSYAEENKPDFIDEMNSKDYQQFVNAMIHISQKHIEKIIFEEKV